MNPSKRSKPNPMNLLIVRHAIAYERDAKRWPDDAHRPLTPEGRKLARKASAGLKRVVDPPGTVLVSPLVRARETAAILKDCAAWPEAIETETLTPDENPQQVLTLLRRQRGRSIALVGHEPHLSELIALCLVGERNGLSVNLKKPGVACLTFESTPAAGGATLKWHIPPRVLRALA
jgi:phosphohistidine phosphatase